MAYQAVRDLLESGSLAARPTAQYDYTPLIRVAIFTGLRIGELLGLRWQDVDLKEAVIRVRWQWTRTGELALPKTSKAIRRVPIAPDLVKLTEHKLASGYAQEGDFVFPSKKGTPLLARNAVLRGFEPALELAGLNTAKPKITFHDLRHAFASIMIERGINSTVLADVMGHRDSRTTERIYVHLFNRQRTDDQVRAAMQSAMNL
jgi:integrase